MALHTSVFDLFKVGLGPSSSHTVGPMRAAALFAAELAKSNALQRVERVAVDLYGSLALTGRGHATDRAVILGLEGFRPDEIAPDRAEACVARVRAEQMLQLGGVHAISFVEERDVAWRKTERLQHHSNAMRVKAFAAAETCVLQRVYYSVGGGFVEIEGATEPATDESQPRCPYAVSSAADLLELSARDGIAIWELVLANEEASRPRPVVIAYVDRILEVMQSCVDRGLVTEGILPGGLNVRRRAPRLYQKFLQRQSTDALAAMDFVNVMAMAVNEENAAGGRVVTAPTNGAAGVIPAVIQYYLRYTDAPTRDALVRFVLTASAIGSLYKNNASISGAEVGCQGEVGVACSMAAGGLVAALGGSNAQVEHAAEIGMEHSLGMTCDPIGGLVQIPCIERNAVGAVRAIQAARMAMEDTGEHHVSLDRVIEVMYTTGLDMQSAYKETSLGGLALGIVTC